MKTYKLYLDDIRIPSMSAKKFSNLADLYNDPDWIVARNYDEFISAITNRWENFNECPSVISFDHDLGEEHIKYYFDNGGHKNPPDPSNANFTEKTGKDCANWLVSYCETRQMPFPDFYVHSANPVGAKNIESYLTQYKKFLRQTDDSVD